MNGLEVRDTAHGRGVFATRALRKGDVVERCPVVLIPPEELVFVPHVRALAYSWFRWLQPHWEKGGGAVKERYGSEFYSEIGKRGGETVKQERGAEYYSTIGRKGGEARNTIEEPQTPEESEATNTQVSTTA